MSDSTPPRRSSITGRSVVAGTLLSLIISIGFTYGRIVLSTSDMSSDHITAGAICVFFLVTLLLNPCIKLIRPRWAFDRAELTVIYIMLIIASTIQDRPAAELIGDSEQARVRGMSPMLFDA